MTLLSSLRCLAKTIALAQVCLVVVWLGLPPLAADEPPSYDTFGMSEVLFVRYVGPILREKCVACHGADPQLIEGGLDLTTHTALAVPISAGSRPLM